MDVGRVLGRSLEIAWRHKVLWVLGFIMALTGGGGGNGFNYNFGNNLNRPIAPTGRPSTAPPVQPAIVITVLAFVACLAILFLILVLYFRFVARGALVTFVRNVEKGGTPTLRSAWGEGHRYYGRLLGLGFLFNIPLLIFTILVVLIAVLPIIGTVIAIISRAGRGQPAPSDVAPIVSGVLASLGLICCAILCLLIVHLVVHPVYEFAVRAIVLEESGTLDGLARGYRRLRLNLGVLVLLYLLLIGARIGWSFVLAIVALPFALILLGIITAAASTQSVGLIVLFAVAIALPFALVFVFLEGLFQVFEANAWTEGYLALLAPPSSPPPLVQPPAPVGTA